jgi:hypothetical protein
MAMTITERAKVIQRAKRALKALTEHPDTSRQQLGTARDRLEDCYRLTEADQVWKAVDDIEIIAATVYGVPTGDEPAPRAVGRWVSPRGRPRPAKPRRARRAPPS